MMITYRAINGLVNVRMKSCRVDRWRRGPQMRVSFCRTAALAASPAGVHAQDSRRVVDEGSIALHPWDMPHNEEGNPQSFVRKK
jgi:hypothetical protein